MFWVLDHILIAKLVDEHVHHPPLNSHRAEQGLVMGSRCLVMTSTPSLGTGCGSGRIPLEYRESQCHNSEVTVAVLGFDGLKSSDMLVDDVKGG